MEHLNPEVLSRLVDESPTADELDHLNRCGRCASELDAVRRQTTALATLPDVRPPRGDWEDLEARLLNEGLLSQARPVEAAARFTRTRWISGAAAVVLFLAGAATGAGVMARPTPTETPDVSAGTAPASRVATTDPGAALAQMQDVERAYMEALVHYRQLVGAQGAEEIAGDPHVRYAALEQLVRAGQDALSQAPADPFLNGLLASAMAEREAVSRRLSANAAQDGWF